MIRVQKDIEIVWCKVRGKGSERYNPRPKSYLRSCKEKNLEYSFKILIRILELFLLDLGSLRSYSILALIDGKILHCFS